jgi:RNA polymerase sigma-70 factor (ECF subfamily)
MHKDKLVKLAGQIAGGEENALHELHILLCDFVFVTALAVSRNRETAEEIVADVFIRLWKQRDALAEVRDLRSYIFIITRNISLDYRRRQPVVKFYGIDEMELPALVVNVTPEDEMISSEMIKRINQAITELPPRGRLIFTLVKTEGLKHQEVAELLDVSIKTVEAQMGIALKRLYASLHIHIPVPRESK